MAEGPKIKWGTIIAGAAIVAGAVLFAPTVMDKLPELGGTLIEGVKNIGSWIVSLFTDVTVTGPSPEALEAARKVAGAAMIGGGAAYLLGGKSESPVSQSNYEQTYTRQADESFAMKEDMRKMQALMVMRAAAAGNPQAQAMLQQQGGRA